MLQVDELSVSFSATHSVEAVRGGSLTLSPAQKTAIIGETGSGKSVLLLAILRLLPAAARVSGHVRWNGTDLLALTERQMQPVRGAEIAYVPQGSGASLHPLLTVGFQVGEPLMQHRGANRRQALRTSIALLDRFNIQPAAERSRNHPHAFSGGMKQRAMVAMGISAGASVILADEPTKGLDERRVAQVRDAFLSLTEQAVLCVTHDLDFAGAIADDIHVMYAGQQVESGPAESLLHHPLHPYTQDMVAARPENGLQVTGGFAPSHTDVVEGCPYRARCRFADSRCATAPPNVEVSVGHTVRCWNHAS